MWRSIRHWHDCFMKFMNDEVENTIYARTVELMRNDPHFYYNQAMQGHGLQEPGEIDPVPVPSSCCRAFVMPLQFCYHEQCVRIGTNAAPSLLHHRTT